MASNWTGADLTLSAKDGVAWERAERQIKAHRCGEVILRLVDDQGQPLRGVPVRFEQHSHTFRFGVQYPYDPVAFDLFQQAGVNAATLWLGWQHVQPERGVYNLDHLDRIWNPAALYERGLYVTARALNWFKPEWHVLPQYLFQVPVYELPHLVYEHVQQLARYWSRYIQAYELVNEPFWVDANAIPMELDDMVLICHAAALAVRDIAPAARLEVNFCEISRISSYHVRPCDLLDALEAQGVSYDSIGLQCLENAYTTTTPPTFFRAKTFTGILQIVRQYAAMGKPLNVSAVSVPSLPPASKPPAAFTLPYGPWNEETQARYLDAFYTLFFAQPEIRGITWAYPVDGRLALVPGGGLLREDLTPKPAYEALQAWIKRHTTSGQTRTDELGKAVISGFAGEYEITAGLGDVGQRLMHTIEQGIIHDRTIVLNPSS